MKETYSLRDDLRVLFSPHDFVIKAWERTVDSVTITFEDDVTYHDGIPGLFPGKKSLILRYHLTDPVISAYRWAWSRLGRKGRGYLIFDEKRIPALCGGRLSFVKQYTAYNEVILELAGPAPLLVTLSADSVEYEWIE